MTTEPPSVIPTSLGVNSSCGTVLRPYYVISGPGTRVRLTNRHSVGQEARLPAALCPVTSSGIHSAPTPTPTWVASRTEDRCHPACPGVKPRRRNEAVNLHTAGPGIGSLRDPRSGRDTGAGRGGSSSHGSAAQRCAPAGRRDPSMEVPMDTAPHVSLRLIQTADRLAHGWPIGSSFVEEFWLPVMGPSAVAVLRWIDRRADQFGRATTVDLAELALAIGLGASTSRHSPIVRALDRLVRFEAGRASTSSTMPDRCCRCSRCHAPVRGACAARRPPALPAPGRAPPRRDRPRRGGVNRGDSRELHRPRRTFDSPSTDRQGRPLAAR